MEPEIPLDQLQSAAAEAERQRERDRHRMRQTRESMTPGQRYHHLRRRRQQYRARAAETSVQRTQRANSSTGRTRLTPQNYIELVSNMNSDHECQGSTSAPSHAHGCASGDGNNEHSTMDVNMRINNGHDSMVPSMVNTSNRRNGHNSARDFSETQGFSKFQLPTPTVCHHCRAKRFQGETKNFCCNGGKVVLPEIPVPLELNDLFIAQNAEGRIFRQNIRAFNHVFSFTSMGVQLDERLATGVQGVYTFRAHGSIYHRIGTLLPPTRFKTEIIQLFIYDTEHEIDNRLQENEGLNRQLIVKIKRILDMYNPFVQKLRQLAQRPAVHVCKLLIKERPVTHNRYSIPTASQVAAVIAGDGDEEESTERDIIVQTIGGQLISLKEFSGYYDPLQYPLLHP